MNGYFVLYSFSMLLLETCSTRLQSDSSVKLEGVWLDSSEAAPAQALDPSEINPPTHRCHDDDKTMQNGIRDSQKTRLYDEMKSRT